MRRWQRLRVVVMWAAGIVLGLSVAAWIASLFWVQWAPTTASGPYGTPLRRAPNVSLVSGLVIANNEPTIVSGWQSTGYRRELYWWPKNKFFYYINPRNAPLCWGVCIPLWIPAACSGLTLGGVLLIGMHARTRAPNDRCITCGYNTTGINGVCPECGNPSL